jgi:hypothetical protein
MNVDKIMTCDGRVVAAVGARRVVGVGRAFDPASENAPAGWWDAARGRSSGVHRDRILC